MLLDAEQTATQNPVLREIDRPEFYTTLDYVTVELDKHVNSSTDRTERGTRT